MDKRQIGSGRENYVRENVNSNLTPHILARSQAHLEMEDLGMKAPRLTEYDVYKQVADYMRNQYRDVLYHFDLSGSFTNHGTMSKTKRIQGQKGWPDFFIPAERSFNIFRRNGLFLEIKAPDAEPYYKEDLIRQGKVIARKGELRDNEHFREQAAMLDSLTAQGFRAEFAVGFDECKRIIDEYLK